MAEELAPLKKRTLAVQNKALAVQRLVTSLEDVVSIRNTWLDDKRDELARAIEAHTQLAAAKADASKLRYSRNRVAMLRKVVNALEAGFIPIPRFDADHVNMSIDQLPIKALIAFNDANASALFDEVKIVRGNDSEAVSRVSRSGSVIPRKGKRDPLLVGVIKMAATRITVAGPWRRDWNGDLRRNNVHRRLPERETHFLIAWWNPEDEVDGDLW